MKKLFRLSLFIEQSTGFYTTKPGFTARLHDDEFAIVILDNLEYIYGFQGMKAGRIKPHP